MRLTRQLLSHRIEAAQESGKNLLAELLLEQERLLLGHRVAPKPKEDSAE